jgi:glucans biosynthesis protein
MALSMTDSHEQLMSRRQVLNAAGGVAIASLLAGSDRALAFAGLTEQELAPPQPFSFESLEAEAARLAKSPYVKAEPPSPEILGEITYDQYQRIRYRADKSLKLGAGGRYPVQMFHLGKYARDPVRMHVVENGQAREVIYTAELFDIPQDHPARKLPFGAGFAGFRIMAENLKTDWFAAMGASYFRTSGPFDQYGVSARGIAIDTAMPKPEEFPQFSNFWLEGPASPDGPVTIYALLEGPSLTGAYRMQTTRVTGSNGIHRIVMDTEASLFVRQDIDRIGIAPFSSMFWYGEAHQKGPLDWRPEIHDSDGLAILTGSGERIWRPIANPPRVMTSAFLDKDVKGFGLLQRDRDFDHYMDDGVFYDRRPSVWVEPLEPWGEGAVHLVEIPTGDETSDNVVAYWAPKEEFKAGQHRTYRYRLSWLDDIAFPDTLARAVAMWTGVGGPPGLLANERPAGVCKFVVDFVGKPFAGLGRDDGVELIVSTSRGTLSNAFNHPVVTQNERWRAFFDLKADGPEPVDLRAFLRRGKDTLTETWLYQYFPGNV